VTNKKLNRQTSLTIANSSSSSKQTIICYRNDNFLDEWYFNFPQLTRHSFISLSLFVSLWLYLLKTFVSTFKSIQINIEYRVFINHSKLIMQSKLSFYVELLLKWKSNYYSREPECWNERNTHKSSNEMKWTATADCYNLFIFKMPSLAYLNQIDII
jgi:hypothetical protein